MLLLGDAGSGMVLGSELLTPRPSPEAMWGRVPENLADQLFALELAPEIRTGAGAGKDLGGFGSAVRDSGATG